MTDIEGKELEFKHAHITGQAMRDHWGPIVDRIAAETADWRDEWIYDLITENERLQRSAEYWQQDAKRYAANQEHWRMEERAAIVAWLDKKAEDFVLNPPHAYSDMITAIVSMSIVGCAEAIEAGEHVK